MKILIIDAQGGRIGKQLVASVKKELPDATVIAVGTNSAATAAMLSAGAENAATGENAVVVACRTADIIVGPIGIAVADSMLGEVTPLMAKAVGQSTAKRVLIPFDNCDNLIVGADLMPVGKRIQGAVEIIKKLCG